MDDSVLLLEIGSVAYGDLSASEIAALLALYSNSQNKIAGMHSFEILKKKFLPTYRMGKTYEKLSDKFENYRRIYNDYAQTVGAGRTTGSATELADQETIDRNKFHSDAN